MKIEGSKLVVLVVAVVVLLACTFALGTSFGQRAMLARTTPELNGVQAMLAFNRIQDDEHVQSLISRGCTDQVGDFIEYTKDKDMELLSGFLRGKIDSDTLKYISDRDAHMLQDLKTFKSKYGNAWLEKPCKPS